MSGSINTSLAVMNKDLKEKFPSWCVDDLKLQNDLMLGDDVDSLLSCCLLSELTNGRWDINYFYDFQSMYKHQKTGLKAIGVDMSFTKDFRTFDNHLVRSSYFAGYNKLSANLNNMRDLTKGQYHRKYPASTLLMIMSYYDIPLPESDIGKSIVLAVDSAFQGHYNEHEPFKQIHSDWFEDLGYTDLIDLMDKHDSEYFKAIQKEYGLNEKIYIKNRKLQSRINLEAIQPHVDFKIELPNKEFKGMRRFKRASHQGKPRVKRDQLVSLSYTSKNHVCYTYQEVKE